MRSVSVSQLKNNPSQALRVARKQPLIVVNRDEPEAVLIHLDDETLPGKPSIRVALALALYKQKQVSLGRAAELANMVPAEFMQCASDYGIAISLGTSRSILEDAKALGAWLEKRSS